jgi:hypothetical protein
LREVEEEVPDICTFLSRSSSHHLLEHVDALGENR